MDIIRFMDNCIFCKIADGTIPSTKIWEDQDFLAILDIMPNTRGMTLVLTKKHYDSYAFDMSDEEYARFMGAAKTVARILEKGLNVHRVALVMEGMGINHAHLKLYPLHGVDSKFKEMWAAEKKFFDRYEGYISTQTGPKLEAAELQKVADEILSKQ